MFRRPEMRAGVREVQATAVMAIASLAISGAFDSAQAYAANNYHESSAAEHVSHHAAVAASAFVGNTVSLELLEPFINKPHHHPNPAEVAKNKVTPVEFSEWSKVNICEEGGNWHTDGVVYAGGLGISKVNWKDYGGNWYDPNEATATPYEQIVIAMKIQPDPPDQDGCGDGW